MLTLALDTSDTRGSVALLRDATNLAHRCHQDTQDYSSWLLPAVEAVVAESGVSMQEVELFAVATGPGSFTGLRVGLSTVKAWAEVYSKPIVGVSRLEALARSCNVNSGLVAVSYDAYRGQLFGALYRFGDGHATRINDEMVISPEEFLAFVLREAGMQPVTWISLDPQMITSSNGWTDAEMAGHSIHLAEALLAPVIGITAQEKSNRGEFSDPLQLDANYVRRSDAEIFWKGPVA